MSIWNRESREADYEKEEREAERKSGFFDLPKSSICRNPSHNFPSHLYIPPGKVYKHVCPGCGFTQTVISSAPNF